MLITPSLCDRPAIWITDDGGKRSSPRQQQTTHYAALCDFLISIADPRHLQTLLPATSVALLFASTKHTTGATASAMEYTKLLRTYMQPYGRTLMVMKDGRTFCLICYSASHTCGTFASDKHGLSCIFKQYKRLSQRMQAGRKFHPHTTNIYPGSLFSRREKLISGQQHTREVNYEPVRVKCNLKHQDPRPLASTSLASYTSSLAAMAPWCRSSQLMNCRSMFAFTASRVL